MNANKPVNPGNLAIVNVRPVSDVYGNWMVTVAYQGNPPYNRVESVYLRERAIRVARQIQVEMWDRYRIASERVVWRRDGTVGKGHDAHATHPRNADPRRSKG